MKRDIPNIICVDWSELSGFNIPFPISYAFYLMSLKVNVPKVGLRIAEFIIFLIKNEYIDGPEMVHIIGVSLGAHVAGVAGLKTKQLTGKKVSRITGLVCNLFCYLI